ncbi:GPI mannosyltransferase 3 [Chrysoperla carnea]|uniref:GPI mannosyltransferase 3 n=1 Tax=Chrysoperla carnea TaxID=189513 RepID=UPI001D095E66|nr:GPI mannosyltransferase 3 [Chrysoperla carnea]
MSIAEKINFGKYVLLHFCILRLLSVWIVNTWYVPDEYWQSTEVAHNFVFGYGYLTWEWKTGLRSYIYPLFIAGIYKTLAFLHLDSAYLLVISPRIAQALLSAYSDYCFYKWTGGKKWAVFLITTQWFWFYTASRTLINTFETSVTVIALSIFPWKGSKYESLGSTTFLWIVAVLGEIRPTAGIHWLPLCAYHFYLQRTRWKWLIFRYIYIGITVLTITTTINSLCYGKLTISIWEFLKANIFQNVSGFYGVLPWYWYFTVGLPTILGVHTLPFVWSLFKLLQNGRYKTNELVLIITIIFTLCVYSFIPHKEFRFMLPILPMCLYICVDYLAPWSSKINRLYVWLVAVTILTSSSVPIYYFSSVHQRGVLNVMPVLQKIASKRPNDTTFLFLMPCHSTPLYSHLHVNVPARILTCEPDFTNSPNYRDEADLFYENPVEWISLNFPAKSDLPSHIIAFDHLHDSSSIFSRYKKIHSEHHTDIPSGRVGRMVNVYQYMDY